MTDSPQKMLFDAAIKGDVEALNYAHRLGVNINGFADNPSDYTTTDHRWSALHIACRKGHVEIARRVLELGADINLLDKTGITRSPLMIATEYGNVDVMKLLIERGANIDLYRQDGISLSGIAAATRKNPEAVWDLLLAPETKLPESQKPTCPRWARSILDQAARGVFTSEDIQTLPAALRRGVDWRVLSHPTGESLLHQLMRKAHANSTPSTPVFERTARVIKLAFAEGVSPLLCNKEGVCSLETALSDAPEFQAVFTEACAPFAQALARFDSKTETLMGKDGKPTDLAIYCCGSGKLGQLFSRERWSDPRKLIEAKQALKEALCKHYQDKYEAELETSSAHRASASQVDGLRSRLGPPRSVRAPS